MTVVLTHPNDETDVWCVLDAPVVESADAEAPDDDPSYVKRMSSFVHRRTIYRGPLSCVDVAMDSRHQERVVIKTIVFPTRSGSIRERARREWEVLESLDHPNIVRAHEFLQNSVQANLILEHISGKDLAQVVAECGPLPSATCCMHAAAIADALAYAHVRAIVHRDVKPSNIVVDESGCPRLIDFGVSLDQAEESLTVQHNESLLGTIDYMAPEQFTHCHDCDGRADVYSLGCTLWFLLTGKAVFPTGSFLERIKQHQNSVPPPLASIQPSVSTSLSILVASMLTKEPSERPSMSEVAAEMKALAWEFL